MILDLPEWLSNTLGFTGTAFCIIAYAYIT